MDVDGARMVWCCGAHHTNLVGREARCSRISFMYIANAFSGCRSEGWERRTSYRPTWFLMWLW